MKPDELSGKIESMLKALIDKHEMHMGGETLDPDILRIETIKDKHSDRVKYDVIFNDENMAYLLAGYVAGYVYDEMEAGFKALGFEMVDGDGATVTLEKEA